MPKLGFDTSTLPLSARVVFRKGEDVFAQGEPADAIYLLESGRLLLTAVSHAGRQAALGMVTPGMFFGESCLAGLPLRRQSATAISDCVVLRISRAEFVRLVHEQRPLLDFFISHLVQRNARFEEDLLDQLFNPSERRLARMLVLLARFDTETSNEKTITGLDQEKLAQMIGTTRAHVSVFMSKFRKMGLIEYDRRVI
ncbi:MAG TPA: Crp/Fnr family transcriptional regulator, partial [Terriglobales bacterium]|nr:Crp/Fnr family transcriptional regulator [Terriglobales bacterium]